MADILLSTLNARYAHAAFGLRYLLANLGELRRRAALLEFETGQRPLEIVEQLLSEKPRVIGLGVHIWNAQAMLEVVALLKRVAPQVAVVLGGPEISHETQEQPLAHLADYIITGEADVAFADLCRHLLDGQRPPQRVIEAPPPDLAQLVLPYELYSEQDLAHRVIYVEASRGCAFGCEFCLSSLDVPLRHFPLDRFLAAMQELLDRGARLFKFVDRTFNLNLGTAKAILEFFLKRYRPGLFLHFEIIPDRLPSELCDLIGQFPPGALQLEIGIQSFNESVTQRIGRRQDPARAEANVRYLRQRSGAHLHADLIVGLPGESLESLAAGFDRLVGLEPQEIQVGILKRLRGASIVRHDEAWGMVYSPLPPYEILCNGLIDFATMQRLRRFARYWDLIANSGNFVETAPLLWRGGSPFAGFLRCSDWLYRRLGRQHAIALTRLGELLLEYLGGPGAMDRAAVAEGLWRDWQRGGRREVPEYLRPWATATRPTTETRGCVRRQERHLHGK